MAKITTPITSRIRIQMEVYSMLCTQPALCQGRKIGGTLGGGPTIRKALTPNPKVAFIYV